MKIEIYRNAKRDSQIVTWFYFMKIIKQKRNYSSTIWSFNINWHWNTFEKSTNSWNFNSKIVVLEWLLEVSFIVTFFHVFHENFIFDSRLQRPAKTIIGNLNSDVAKKKSPNLNTQRKIYSYANFRTKNINANHCDKSDRNYNCTYNQSSRYFNTENKSELGEIQTQRRLINSKLFTKDLTRTPS